MRSGSAFIYLALFFAAASMAAPAAQHQTAPGTTHEAHHKQTQHAVELKARGAAAMGFDQDATEHRFPLADDGGSIEVQVKDAADAKNREAIRAHLREIAVSFKQGDFSRPFQTHAEVPPGVEQMKALKDSISYTYEETPGGGRVRIRTSDSEALKAIHEFLNYQTREHHTS